MTKRRNERAVRGSTGATLIEFALVLPILVLLAFGTAELGLGWTAENRVQGAVSQAARVGAASGAQRESDRDVLLALKVSLEPDVLASLERVVIYSALDADGQVPESCRTATGNNGNSTAKCNSYSGNLVRQLAPDGSNAGALGLSTPASTCTQVDRYWCPTLRKDSLVDPPDWLGVWIKTSYPNPISVIFGDFSMERSAIYRLQPDFTG